MSDDDKKAKPRGVAAMSEERRREVASMGGKAAHAASKAHRFTSEEAREAGRKGGQKLSQDREQMRAIGRRGGAAVSADREHMAEIGKKGGDVVGADAGHMAEIGRRGGSARGRDESEAT
jgi:uncharacterized protein